MSTRVTHNAQCAKLKLLAAEHARASLFYVAVFTDFGMPKILVFNWSFADGGVPVTGLVVHFNKQAAFLTYF